MSTLLEYVLVTSQLRITASSLKPLMYTYRSSACTRNRYVMVIFAGLQSICTVNIAYAYVTFAGGARVYYFARIFILTFDRHDYPYSPLNIFYLNGLLM